MSDHFDPSDFGSSDENIPAEFLDELEIDLDGHGDYLIRDYSDDEGDLFSELDSSFDETDIDE